MKFFFKVDPLLSSEELNRKVILRDNNERKTAVIRKTFKVFEESGTKSYPDTMSNFTQK